LIWQNTCLSARVALPVMVLSVLLAGFSGFGSSITSIPYITAIL
jgi:hypothetical protein